MFLPECLQSMGKHVSDYASALVASPKTGLMAGPRAFVLDTTAGVQSNTAASKLAGKTQPPQQNRHENLNGRRTERAPTAESIRDGIIQASASAQEILPVVVPCLSVLLRFDLGLQSALGWCLHSIFPPIERMS